MSKSKSPKYCIVPCCKNTTRTSPNKIFINVPKNENIRNSWCVAMNRDPSTNVKLTNKSTRYVCEDHFNIKEDMENYMEYMIMPGVPIRMKKNILPHIFLCQQRENPSALNRKQLSPMNQAPESDVKMSENIEGPPSIEVKLEPAYEASDYVAEHEPTYLKVEPIEIGMSYNEDLPGTSSLGETPFETVAVYVKEEPHSFVENDAHIYDVKVKEEDCDISYTDLYENENCSDSKTKTIHPSSAFDWLESSNSLLT